MSAIKTTLSVLPGGSLFPGRHGMPSLEKPPSVLRVFIITIGSIFLIDAASMFILSFLRPLPFLAEALLAAVLISVFLLPLLYFFYLKPMERYVREGRVIMEALRSSEGKYRSLVESTDNSIYLIDRQYRYLFINKKHLARLGISGEEYLGKTYGDFHDPQVTKGFIRKIDRVLATGEPLNYEHKSQRDNEYYLLTLSPVKDADGKVTAVTVVSKKITELKRLQEELRALSLTDELTGLFNRRGFLTLADQHIKIAARQRTKVFMLYADLDALKSINDTYGHPEGDRALVETARILRETFRESDIVARIGGDEFVVMPIGTNEENTSSISERLQKRLDAHNAPGRKCRISISIGIAQYDPSHPCTVEELLAQGDRMMYERKRNRQKG